MLNTSSKSPKHLKVANVLRKRIRKGQYLPGENLPTIRHLSAELGVSTNVVQRSLQLLEAEGVVCKKHGVGVEVAESDAVENTPLTIGFVYPFSNDLNFAGSIHCFVEQAVDLHKNHCIIKSSSGDPAIERQIIEQFCDQGVDGLVVWPCEGKENVEFFDGVSKRTKIVFVDRSFDELSIPGVVMDCKRLGVDVVQRLGSAGLRKVLILVDPLRISTYEEMYDSMREMIVQISGQERFSLKEITSSSFMTEYATSPHMAVEKYYRQLEAILKSQEFDAIFCPHDEFVDRVYACTDLVERFPVKRVMCVTDSKLNPRSLNFYDLEAMEWITDFFQMIKKAVEILDRMVHLNSRAYKEVRIKFFPIIRKSDRII